MVRKVRECGLEPHLQRLMQLEGLRQSTRNRRRARPDKAAYSAVADAPRSGNRIERVDVVVAVQRAMRRNRVSDAIRSQSRAAEDQVQVRCVVPRARRRSKVRTRLSQRNRADLPATKDRVLKPVHVA